MQPTIFKVHSLQKSLYTVHGGHYLGVLHDRTLFGDLIKKKVIKKLELLFCNFNSLQSYRASPLLDPLVGRFWPAHHMFDTPDLEHHHPPRKCFLRWDRSSLILNTWGLWQQTDSRTGNEHQNVLQWKPSYWDFYRLLKSNFRWNCFKKGYELFHLMISLFT